MKRLRRLLLIVRWFIGATVAAKEEWRVREIESGDTFKGLLEYTRKMRAEGWEDFAGFGDRLYLRRFVERWPYPSEVRP